MADSLLETKLREAVERSRGDKQAAVRLLIAWCERDEALFRALAQPFLQGIALHLVDRAIKQITGDPTAPLAAQSSGAKTAKAAETEDGDESDAPRAAQSGGAKAAKTPEAGTGTGAEAGAQTGADDDADAAAAPKAAKPASGKTLDIGLGSDKPAAAKAGDDTGVTATSKATKPATGKTLDLDIGSGKPAAARAGDGADAATAPKAAKPAAGKTLDLGVGSEKPAAGPAAKPAAAKAPAEKESAEKEPAEPPMVVGKRSKKGELPPALIDALVERWGAKIPVATQPTLDHPPRTVEEALQSLGKAGPPPPGKASGRHQSGMRLIAKVQRIRRATQG
jgi:hypothetical protein